MIGYFLRELEHRQFEMAKLSSKMKNCQTYWWSQSCEFAKNHMNAMKNDHHTHNSPAWCGCSIQLATIRGFQIDDGVKRA